MGKVVGLTFAKAKDGGPTREQLVEQALALGIEVPSKATKAQIAELIAAAAPQGPQG